MVKNFDEWLSDLTNDLQEEKEDEPEYDLDFFNKNFNIATARIEYQCPKCGNEVKIDYKDWANSNYYGCKTCGDS